MRRFTWTLLGGTLLLAAATAQDPPPAPLRLRLAQKVQVQPAKQIEPRPASKAKAKAAPPAGALPAGAVARLGFSSVRNDATLPTIVAVAYSPDGRTLATVDNQSAHLWDTTTGQELRALPVPGVAAAGAAAAAGALILISTIVPPVVAFAPDGRSVALMTRTQVTVWETATGKPAAAWKPLGAERATYATPGFAWAPDGQAIIGLVYNAPPAQGFAVVVWNALTGKEVWQVPLAPIGPTSTFTALAVTLTDRSLAVALSGHPIQVIESASGRLRDEVALPRAGAKPAATGTAAAREPQAVALAPDGRTLYAITPDGDILARDLTAGRDRRFGTARPGGPMHLSADGKVLAVRSTDGAVRVYDAATGRLRQRLAESPPNNRIGPGTAFALSPDGTTVAAPEGNGVRYYDVATGRHRAATGHTAAVTSVVFAADGRTLVSGAQDAVIAWDVSGRAEVVRAVHGDRVRAMAVSADGKWRAEGGFDGRVRVVEIATNRVAHEFDAGKRLTALAFSPDGRALAGAEAVPLVPDADPRPVRRWDLTTGAALPPLPAGAAPTLRLFFSPDGRRLVGTDPGDGAQVWDVTSGRLLWQVPPRVGQVGGPPSAAISPDGRRLVLTSARGPVRLFDAADGDSAGDLEGHAGPTHAVAFAPDSRTLVTGGADGAVRVWDVETGTPLHRLAGHPGGVHALSYSSDGALLASGGADAAILLWDAARLGRPTPAAPPPAPELTAEQIAKCWADLATDDAKAAYRAMRALASSPGAAVPHLKEVLPPAQLLDADRLAALLADLDHDQFARRQKATAALAAFGTSARDALRRHMATRPSAEARQRIEDLLEKLDTPAKSGDDLRRVRAVEVLEWAGTPAARALLEELAKGQAGATLTHEAQAALGRMK